MRITEADIREDRWDGELMTRDEWWAEFRANACCPDPQTAAARLCGCGGSGQLPPTISRLL